MTSTDIRTKRIFDPASEADGLRVLVDRIWPRGMTREAAAIDFWMKELGPSHELRKWFGHRPERWKEFVTRYHQELGGDTSRPLTSRLMDLAQVRGRLTLLYSARDIQHNQAIALQTFLRANE